jgi:hypothetical protein
MSNFYNSNILYHHYDLDMLRCNKLVRLVHIKHFHPSIINYFRGMWESIMTPVM